MARIGLTQLPRRVQKYVQDVHNQTVDAGAYRRYFDGAVSNRFPAEFSNGRWTVDEVDLEKVALAMKMIPNAKGSDLSSAQRSGTLEHVA